MATKLVQAAALVAVLVPLGAATAESATITCQSDGGPCGGSGFGDPFGSYPAGGVGASNIWKFFTNPFDPSTLIYTLEITQDGAETPDEDTTLTVSDVVGPPGFIESFFGEGFSDLVCVPVFDASNCTIYDVFVDGDDTWDYLAEITWFINSNPLSEPGTATILQSHDFQDGGEPSGTFDDELTDGVYDPAPTPTDPAMLGRGDNWSALTVATNSVPEPASLGLLGCGLAGLLLERRRRSRRSQGKDETGR